MKKMATMTTLQVDGAGVVAEAQAKGIVPISNQGRTVAFVVSREKLAAIMETMELQKNSELMELVQKDRAGKLKFKPVPDEI